MSAAATTNSTVNRLQRQVDSLKVALAKNERQLADCQAHWTAAALAEKERKLANCHAGRSATPTDLPPDLATKMALVEVDLTSYYMVEKWSGELMQAIHSEVELTARKIAAETKLKSREKGGLGTSPFEQPDPAVAADLRLAHRKAQAALEASNLRIELAKLDKALTVVQAERKAVEDDIELHHSPHHVAGFTHACINYMVLRKKYPKMPAAFSHFRLNELATQAAVEAAGGPSMSAQVSVVVDVASPFPLVNLVSDVEMAAVAAAVAEPVPMELDEGPDLAYSASPAWANATLALADIPDPPPPPPRPLFVQRPKPTRTPILATMAASLVGQEKAGTGQKKAGARKRGKKRAGKKRTGKKRAKPIGREDAASTKSPKIPVKSSVPDLFFDCT